MPTRQMNDPSPDAQLFDAAVPLLAGAVIAVGVSIRADPGTLPLALALGLGAAAALTLRRRVPTVTLAVTGGLVLALFAVDDAAGVIAGPTAPALRASLPRASIVSGSWSSAIATWASTSASGSRASGPGGSPTLCSSRPSGSSRNR